MSSYDIGAFNSDGFAGVMTGRGTKAEILEAVTTLPDWFAGLNWTGANAVLTVGRTKFARNLSTMEDVEDLVREVTGQPVPPSDSVSPAGTARSGVEGTKVSDNKVVSVKGGKVHYRYPFLGAHVFPACRSGDMTNSGTQYRTTDQPVDCKTCSTYDAEAYAVYHPDAEAADPTRTVSEFLNKNNPNVGRFTTIGESCSLDSVDHFRADAVSKLGDLTEVSGADLKAANWDELYEWHKHMRADDTPTTVGGVRGDILVGAVGNSTIMHAIQETDSEGRHASYCPTKFKDPLRLFGPAAEQKPELPLCRACGKAVPTGAVTVTTEEVPVPGLGTTVQRTVYIPTEEESETVAKKTDVDAVISGVHEIIDQIKALEGDAAEADKLGKRAEEQIQKLPTAKRNSLRSQLKDAVDSVSSSAAVVKVSDDPNDYEGVPALIELGSSKAREGVELGVQMGSLSEAVAHVILDISTRIVNPKTGLPDIKKEMKATRDAAGEIYASARQGVEEDDVQRIAAHNSLVKSVQNRASDVLVEWLRAFDSSSDTAVLTELFPGAAALVESDSMTPSDAIRKVYADKGVDLPERGRKEIERERARVKSLQKTVKELEAAQERKEVESDELDKNELSQLNERIETLQGKSEELRAQLPESALKAIKETTPQERAFSKVEKAEALFTAATKGADKLNDDERADLKARLNDLVSKIAAEAAKL